MLSTVHHSFWDSSQTDQSKMKYLAVFLLTIFLLAREAISLKCWVCVNARSNEECNAEGKMKECLPNENACQNELRTDNNGMLITKRCKAAHACDNNFIQNPRPAWFPTQCNPDIAHTVCRCCCNANGCNALATFCLKAPMRCTALSSPQNGRKQCNYQMFEDELGSTCQFSCDQGFSLDGAPASECRETGAGATVSFDFPVPQCIKTTCDPPQRNPTNGAVTCTNSNFFESECTFSCSAGFFLSGSVTTTCRVDNTWSNFPPFCQRIRCLPVQTAPLNGGLQCSRGNNLGSICRFSCNAGYELVGDVTRTCLDDNDGDAVGLWSNTRPRCQRITCQPPHNEPLNGNVGCSSSNNEGSVCNFVCDANFALIGSSQSVCVDDGDGDVLGEWTSSAPTCEPVVCEPPQFNPTNGDVSCTRGNRATSLCSFSCSPGYARVGSLSTSCNDDNNGDTLGAWTNPPAQCVLITCSPPHDNPLNGVVVCSNSNNIGSACSFRCNSGFTLSGEQTSTCRDDFDGDVEGLWSSPAPTCERKTCEEAPVAPVNGFRVCSDGNFLSSQCEYGCNDYHRRIGPLYTNCIEPLEGVLIWDNPAPICDPIECLDQGGLRHGAITCSNSNFASSTCEFTCTDENYSVFPATFTENTCRNDTTWSLPKPCCARPCPPFAVMDAVFILDSSSSIGDSNWILLKAFVRGLVGLFNIGPGAGRISVFRFNRVVDTETQILLNDFSSTSRLLEKYDQIPYDGSGTFTGNALNHARQVIFQQQNGDRSDVINVVVMITDGRSQDNVEVPARRLRQSGALIFVIGIMPPRGELDRAQLNQIASNPNNVLIAESGFAALNDVFSAQITDQICRDPCFEATS